MSDPPGDGAGEAAGWRTLAAVAWQRRWQDRTSRWSPDRLALEQARRLSALRRFAFEHSPFYRRFHGGLEHRPLAELPVLDKARLMGEFDAVVTDRAIRLAEVERHLAAPGFSAGRSRYLGRYVALATSGSTGRRGVFLFGEGEWTTALAAISRPLLWSGAPPVWRRPRAALVASSAPWHYSARVGQSLATRLVPTLRLDAAMPLRDLVAALNDWQPQVLGLYPSVLAELADEQLAGRLAIAPQRIATSAERLPDQTRLRVRAAWGLPVFDTYGATEYAPLATECGEGRLHLLEDRAIIEIADARGRPVPPGEPGERVLLTVLDRRVQPLIRYEISDRLCERPGRCPCGRPFRVIGRIEGRVEETLVFAPAGAGDTPVPVHPNGLHAVLERVPALSWQVFQSADGTQLRVNLVQPAHEQVAAEVQRALAGLLRERGARVPAISVRPVAALERGASGKALLIARESAAAPR